MRWAIAVEDHFPQRPRVADKSSYENTLLHAVDAALDREVGSQVPVDVVLRELAEALHLFAQLHRRIHLDEEGGWPQPCIGSAQLRVDQKSLRAREASGDALKRDGVAVAKGALEKEKPVASELKVVDRDAEVAACRRAWVVHQRRLGSFVRLHRLDSQSIVFLGATIGQSSGKHCRDVAALRFTADDNVQIKAVVNRHRKTRLERIGSRFEVRRSRPEDDAARKHVVG